MSERDAAEVRGERPTEPAILRETADWLVVDKPAGWHSVRGTTAPDATGRGVLEAWLAHARPELAALSESGLVHRLDRDTSGCVVVARSRTVQADLTRRFRAGRGVRKVYLARLEHGIAAEGEAQLHFASRHKRSSRVTVSERGDARSTGRMRWRVLTHDATQGDLVELELIGAGKRHQLRASCAHLGHPIVGDPLYGKRRASELRLHAWRVVIDAVEVTAPLPTWAEAEANGPDDRGQARSHRPA